jgi:hypothetical protein
LVYPAARSLVSREWEAVAMPEQRARVLRATRSPRRSCRTGPDTVATWMMDSPEMNVPSLWCHVTLHNVSTSPAKGEERDKRAAELREDFIEKWDSSKNSLHLLALFASNHQLEHFTSTYLTLS